MKYTKLLISKLKKVENENFNLKQKISFSSCNQNDENNKITNHFSKDIFQVLENIPYSFCVTKIKTGEIVYFNKFFSEILEYKHEDLVGKTVVELGINKEEARKKLLKIIKEERLVTNYPIDFYTSSGKTLNSVISSLIVETTSDLLFTFAFDNTKSVKIEKELAQSIQKLNFIIDNTAEGIVLIQDGKTQYLNSKSLSFLKLNTDSLSEKQILDYVHPEDYEYVTNLYSKAKSGISSLEINVFRIVNSSGGIKNIKAKFLSIIWDEKPSILILIEDITSYVTAAETIKEKEEQFKALFYENNLPRLVIDADTGQIIDVNESACRFYGYSKTKLLDLQIYNLAISPREIVENRTKNIISEFIKVLRVQHKTSTNVIKDVEVYTGAFIVREKKYIYLTVIDISDKLIAEKLLRESEEKYRILTDYTPDVIFMIDNLGRFLFINEQSEKLFGYKAKNVIGRRFEEFIPNDEYIKLSQMIDLSFAKEINSSYESYVINVNGELIPVEIKGRVIKKNGIYVGIGTIRNITERRNAEAALIENEEKFRFILESTIDTIFMVDITGKLIFVNENREKVFGWSAEELTGNYFHEKIPQSELPIFFSSFDILFKNKQVSFETLIIHKNGGLVPVEMNVFMTVHKEKKVVLGSVRDITERKKNEKLLEETLAATTQTKDFLRNIINASSDLIYAKTKDEKYLFANENFLKHQKFNNESIKYKTNYDLDLISKNHNKEDFISIAELQETDYTLFDSNEVSYLYNIKLGFTEYIGIFDIQKIPLADQNNEIFCILTIAHDITRRAGAETELILINKNLEKIIDEKTSKLLNTQMSFEHLFNKNNDSLIITSQKGIIIAVNETICRELGYLKEELIGRPVNEITTDKYNEKRKEILSTLSENKSVIFETENITNKGRIIPIEISSSVINFNGEVAILSAGRDITERKMMQKKIMKAIIDTEEKERRRFAGEIHDGIGALLSGIKMYVDFLAQDDLAHERIPLIVAETKLLIDEAAQNAKEMANNIKPHILTNFGLKFSLKNTCDSINKLNKVKIEYNFESLKSNLESNFEFSIYRIINELLNNTLKHAQATEIKILIYIENQKMSIFYSDNGVGFDIFAEEATGGGSGLSNISNRVQSINGEYKLKTSIGNGIQVEISIDLTDFLFQFI